MIWKHQNLKIFTFKNKMQSQYILKQSNYSKLEIGTLNRAKMLILFYKYARSNKSDFKNYHELIEHESFNQLQSFAERIVGVEIKNKHASNLSSDNEIETNTNFTDKSKVFLFTQKHYILKEDDPVKALSIHDFGKRLSK